MKQILYFLSFWCLSTFAARGDYVVPAQPQTFDTSFSLPQGGKTHQVSQGGDLQAAINSALPGDVIVLAAGASWTGNFVLPNKQGYGWIYIISSDLAYLPENNRVTAADLVHMPRIIQSNDPYCIRTADGAHHYRFVGIDFESPGGSQYSYIRLFQGGYMADSEAKLPSYIWFDRCYFRCTTDAGECEYGALLDGKYMAVLNSRMDNFKTTTSDGGYCIKVYNGTGPYKISNNYLEASGSNFFAGGENQPLASSHPSNIEFTRNYLTKRDGWSGKWRMKNLFELKDAKLVLIEGNIFYHDYYDSTGGQYSTAIVLTVRAGNLNPNSTYTIQDITIRNNIIRDVGTGIRFWPGDIVGEGHTTAMNRVLVENNVFDTINNNNFSHSRLIMFTAPVGTIAYNITIRHCLFLFSSSYYTSIFFENLQLGQAMVDHLTLTDNIIDNRGGITGNALYPGIKTISDLTTNSHLANNIVIGTDSIFSNDSYYPFPQFVLVADIGKIGFIDPASYNYLLQTGSAYKGTCSDGSDPGPDIPALASATATTITGSGRPLAPINLRKQ